ncbi:MAG: hypothetical protein Q9194_005733 [Teloschistes cf. exilis]
MSLATTKLERPVPAASTSALTNHRTGFQKLVEDVRDVLGSESDLTTSDNIRNKLEALLEDYKSMQAQWQEYIFKDPSMTFTRNLVSKGNGRYNLILQGRLIETRYAWPSQSRPAPMLMTKETTSTRDEVIYMADSLGLHKISNPDPKEYAVSLHCMSWPSSIYAQDKPMANPRSTWLTGAVYTPPNAAMEGCQIFDAESGKATHCKVYEYYSEFGRKAGG